MASPVTIVTQPNFKHRTVVVGFEEDTAFYSSESHTISVKKSTYPAESGIEVTDHAVREPAKLSLKGIISTASVRSAEELFANALGGRTGRQHDLDLPRDAWITLTGLADRRELLTVYTMLGAYKNMMITQLSTELDASTGQSLPFTIELEEYLYVDLFGGDATIAGASDFTEMSIKGEIPVIPVTEFGESTGTFGVIYQIPLDGAYQEFIQQVRIPGRSRVRFRVRWNGTEEGWELTVPYQASAAERGVDNNQKVDNIALELHNRFFNLATEGDGYMSADQRDAWRAPLGGKEEKPDWGYTNGRTDQEKLKRAYAEEFNGDLWEDTDEQLEALYLEKGGKKYKAFDPQGDAVFPNDKEDREKMKNKIDEVFRNYEEKANPPDPEKKGVEQAFIRAFDEWRDAAFAGEFSNDADGKYQRSFEQIWFDALKATLLNPEYTWIELAGAEDEDAARQRRSFNRSVSRRMTVNEPIGNAWEGGHFYVYAIDKSDAEPARNAWNAPTHRFCWASGVRS